MCNKNSFYPKVCLPIGRYLPYLTYTYLGPRYSYYLLKESPVLLVSLNVTFLRAALKVRRATRTASIAIQSLRNSDEYTNEFNGPNHLYLAISMKAHHNMMSWRPESHDGFIDSPGCKAEGSNTFDVHGY
jgi:hypothetical protein